MGAGVEVTRHLLERDLLREAKSLARDLPKTEDGYKPATKDFIDGLEFDGKKPIEYLNSFDIGIKDDPSLAGK